MWSQAYKSPVLILISPGGVSKYILDLEYKEFFNNKDLHRGITERFGSQA
jgi:hypothetical protein